MVNFKLLVFVGKEGREVVVLSLGKGKIAF